MLRVLRWLADFWYVPLLIIVAVFGVVVAILMKVRGGDGWDPFAWVAQELRVIEAGREVRQVKIDSGEAAALARVEVKYAEKRRQLAIAEKSRMKELENDPVALARALERASRK